MARTNANFDKLKTRLLDPEADVKAKLVVASEIKDSMEIVHTVEYDNFLRTYLPAFRQLLKEIPPQTSETPEDKLRHMMLDILNRLPHNEVLRPLLPELLQLTMEVLVVENEENSVLCLRTLFDLHKDFRPNLETEVQMFLEFVAEIYTGFKETVTHFFGPASAGAPTEGETPAAVIDDGFLGKAKPGEVPTSKRSFRVVTECPVIVMFLFQLYPRHIAQNTPKLLPVMVQAISVPGPPPDQVPQFLKKAFEDLKAAQVKTVSFLTYLLQRFAEEIRVHQDTIAGSVVGLLKTCPDSVAIRKELLVATRNYLVTDFRKGFYKYVPMLLDEKVLVGKGRACYAMLRPQAYSLLAELIHHVRMDLTHAQLGHVIYLFSRNLHDVTLPLTLHTISFRLMLTLVDCIYQRRHETNEGRVLLGKITEAFMQRLGTLKRSVPKLLKVMKQKAEDDAAAAAAKAGTATTAMDGSTAVVAKLVDGKGAEGQADEKDQEKKSDVLYLKAGVEPIKEVHDNKNLLRTIVLGMKTLVWSISNYNRPNNPTPGQPAPVPPPAPRGPKGLTPEELHTTSRLLTSGLSCLRLFFETGDGEEILEPFGGVFTVMEHRNFLDLVNTQFPRMFVAIVETPPLCKIVAWLLNNQQLSIHMTDILMTYLMNNKLHMLTQPDHPDTVLVLRLFHLIFSALSKYNDVELVIRPHTAALVEACLKGLLQATDPQAIIRLMRYIFRSFTHSKIESLYREFLPLLPQALHLLLTMLEAPDEHNLEDALVELCLRLPVRLSALAPFLPSMMKPILCALRSKQDELVVLGLCVLDNWVDQMYTQFLHYNTKLVDSELLSALWNVLKPPSQPTASHPNPNTLFTIPFKAMSILGKLGANNQAFLKSPLLLDCKDNPEHGLRFVLTFQPATSFLVPMDRCVLLAQQCLDAKGDPTHRRQAMAFLRACLASLLAMPSADGAKSMPSGAALFQSLSCVSDETLAAAGAEETGSGAGGGKAGTAGNPEPQRVAAKTNTQLEAERELFTSLLQTVVACSMEKELADENQEFVEQVATHFALLYTTTDWGAPKPKIPDPTPAELKAKADKAATIKAEREKAAKEKVTRDIAAKEKAVKEAGEKAVAAGADADKVEAAKAAAEKAAVATAAAEKLPPTPTEAADAAEAAAKAAAALQVLDPGLCLDAVIHVLQEGKPMHQKAALHFLETLLTPLLQLARARYVAKRDKASGGKGRAAAAVGLEEAAGSIEGSGGRADKKGKTDKDAAPFGMDDLPPVCNVLMKRALHCCYGGNWRGLLGGLMAVSCLIHSALPLDFLRHHEPSIVRALLHIQRRLPEHATVNSTEVHKALVCLLEKCHPRPAGLTAEGAAAAAAAAAAAEVAAEEEASVGDAMDVDPKKDTKEGSKEAKESSKSSAKDRKAADKDQKGKEKESAKKDKESLEKEVDAHGRPPMPTALVQVLADEIFSIWSSAAARKTTEALLRQLGATLGYSEAELLRPFYADQLERLLHRPLSARPLEVQMDTAATVTYLLGLSPPLIKLNDPAATRLPDILNDALAVANSNHDEPGIAMRIPHALNPSRSVLQTQLRTACIEMLVVAMASGRVASLVPPPSPLVPEGMDPATIPALPTPKLRQEVIAMYFKTLSCRTPGIVNASKAGLEQAIKQQKLQKDLLQSSLRPILGPICSHHRYLSLPLLQGLARMLQLLSNWFNVTLGEKLIDHLNKWIEPDKLVQARNTWKPGEEVKIADSLINLFHLLPAMAVKFLDDLVQLVIKLEEVLPVVGTDSPLCSPYQASLTRYLCVYKKEAVEYFITPERLAATPYYTRFVSMLKSQLGAPLRAELAASPQALVAATLGADTWAAAEKVVEARSGVDPALLKVQEVERRMEERKSKWDKAKAEEDAAKAEAAKAAAAKAAAGGDKKGDKPKGGALAAPPTEPEPPVQPAPPVQYQPDPKDVKELDAANAKLAAVTKAVGVELKALTEVLGKAVDLQHHGLYLIMLLAQRTPGWLSHNAPLVEVLRAKWCSPTRLANLDNEKNLTRTVLLETKRLVKCFLVLLREDHTQIELLFELLSVFKSDCTVDAQATSCVDFNFLREFLQEEVAKQYLPAERCMLLDRFLRMFQHTFASSAQQGSQEGLVNAMELLVIPMLEDTLAQPFAREVINEPMVVRIVRDLMEPQEAVAAKFDEPLRIQMLQLATLMIRKMPTELHTHKKELIKFGWNHLKHEDTKSKQWAFINVCQFLDAYQAPEKIILQVFVALLRTCQPEGKHLVREALDVLTPVLPKRLPNADQHRTPMWIRYTKKVLVEEGHSQPHLNHIWQLIVRHPDLFYPSRALFVPQMVNAVSKLAFQNGALAENRRLALDVAGLVIRWAKRTKDAKEAAAAAGVGAATAALAAGTVVAAGVTAAEAKPMLTGGAAAAAAGGGEDSEMADADKKSPVAASKRKRDDGKEDAAKRNKGPTAKDVKDAKEEKEEVGVKEEEEGGGPKDSAAAADGTLAAVPATAAGAKGSEPVTPSKTDKMEEEFMPTPQMEEMLVVFSTRMVFVAVGEQKDRESAVCQAAAQDLVTEILQVWPTAAQKFTHMMRFLDHAVASANKERQQGVIAGGQPAAAHASSRGGPGGRGLPSMDDVHPHLASGLRTLNRVMEQQPKLFVQTNAKQIKVVLEPVLKSHSNLLHTELCDLLTKLVAVYPPGAADASPDTAEVYEQLHVILDAQLTAAAAAGACGPLPPAALHGMTQAQAQAAQAMPSHGSIAGASTAGALRVLNVLLPTSPKHVDRHIANVVKLLVRQAARNAASHRFRDNKTGMFLSPKNTPLPPPSGCPPEPFPGDYGSAVCNVRLALNLLGDPTLLATSDHRKQFPVAMAQQLSDRFVDKQVLLAVLKALTHLVTGGAVGADGEVAVPGLGSLPQIHVKELKQILNQLSSLRKANIAAALTPEFEEAFMNLIFELRKIDTSGVAPPPGASLPPVEIRNPMFIQGLRVQRPSVRQRFFDVYDETLEKSLFHRLDFVFRRQDWNGLADIFWLKQALDMVLALLSESRTIILAPNSATVKPVGLGATYDAATAAAAALQTDETEKAKAKAKEEEEREEEAAPAEAPAPAEGEEAAAAAKAKAAAILKEVKYKPMTAAARKAATEKVERWEKEASAFAPILKKAQEAQQRAKEAKEAKDAREAQAKAKADAAATAKDEVAKGSASAPKDASMLTGADVDMEDLSRDGEGTPAEGAEEAEEEGDAEAAANRAAVEGLAVVCDKHAAFLGSCAQLSVKELITPLREVAHLDAPMAYHLWVLMFTIVWGTLTKDEQETLAKSMINLLSREHHQKQQYQRPNVIQALMEGILFSEPQIKIPAELMKFLGKRYNVCHIAIPLLEHHLSRNLLKDVRGFHALADLYKHLSEEDMLAGLWRADEAILQWLPQNLYPKQPMERLRHTAASVCEETRAGMALVQHGFWPEAQRMFADVVARKGLAAGGNGGANKSGVIGREEMCLWEEQWLEASMQMNQWELLEDFAKGVDHVDLLMECQWRSGNWASLKEGVLSRAAPEEPERLCAVKAYFALASDGDPNNSMYFFEQGMHAALRKWWQLPELIVQPHLNMLHLFQVLVEMQESARMLVELHSARRYIDSPDFIAHNLKEIEVKLDQKLEVWRMRMPNDWDGLPWWSEVLQWRHHMYNVVIRTFDKCESSNPHLHQLGYREKAWSVNKFAAVARRQGLPDTCVTILTKMYNYTRIEVQEAFAKVREQAKAYLALEGEATAGLNLVNTTNLEYLPSNATHSTAEIFRLKGLLLAKLGDAEQANQAFSSALQLCQGSKGGCWISWGTHCEERYALEKAAGQSGGAAGLMWLENMMTCYMMALRDASPASRTLVPRVLSLLSFETAAAPAADGSPGSAPIVHLVWGRLIEQVPTNVWLMYIPQLLLSLQRPEAALVQRLLSQVAAAYPQAIYCWLRTFLLERRDPRMVGGAAAAAKKEEDAAAAAKEKEGEKVAKKEEEEKPGAVTTTTTTAVAGSANASAGPTSTMAFDAAKEVMESLRHGHANLAAEMEVLLTEVGSKFMPNPEERLLAVVHALLHRFYKYPTATSGPVPQPLQRELAGVCRACFSTESSSGLARHSEFVKEYKEEFARELGPDSPDFPPTLAKATARLKEWRTRLQNNVEDRGPSVLCLEDESKMLRDFRPLEVEMPGAHLGGGESHPETNVRLAYISPDVTIVRRHGTCHRRLTLVGCDGKQQHFLVQTSLTPNRSDERVVQLMRHLNRLLDKHKQSRRRHLQFHTPVVVPVWPQVRLLAEEPKYVTFGEAYEMHHARHGRDADVPITFFKESLDKAILTPDMPAQRVWDLRLSTYREIIMSNYVIDTILKHSMIKQLQTEYLGVFKKQFMAQMALSSFLSATFHLGGRSPTKTLFAKNSGKVLQLDFHPLYTPEGHLESAEPVPFRLTRNLQSFFTAYGIEGLFIASLGATAQALTAPHSPLEHQLTLFFRDELMTHQLRPQRPGPDGGAPPPRPSLATMVQDNVQQVLWKVKELRPEAPVPTGGELAPRAVNGRVMELVEAACNPKNICRMEPTWHPWF